MATITDLYKRRLRKPIPSSIGILLTITLPSLQLTETHWETIFYTMSMCCLWPLVPQVAQGLLKRMMGLTQKRCLSI